LIQYIVYFNPLQTVAVTTKELSRDTPYTYKKFLTPYKPRIPIEEERICWRDWAYLLEANLLSNHLSHSFPNRLV